jgi:hypothetical protein
VFRENRRLPAKLVVEAVSIEAPALDDAVWQSVFKEAPVALRTRFEAMRSTTMMLEQQSLPPGTQLVPRSEINQFFQNSGRGLEETWDQFHARWGVPGYHGVSRPIVSDDGLNALAYHEVHCGSLCGFGVVIWLTRASANAPWLIRIDKTTWVS